MATPRLSIIKRSAENARDIRADGRIPAVIYGPGLKAQSSTVELEYEAFRKTLRDAGESTIIELETEEETIPVLIHLVDFNPVTNLIDHVDFYAVNMNAEVHTHIMLEFVGTAPARKEKNAILVRSKESLEVKCLPKDLVHDIKVDISGLVEFHDHVLVKDIAIPAGITVLDNPEDVVISATAPKLEVEEPEEGAAATDEESAEGEKKEGSEPSEENKKSEQQEEK